MAVDALARSLAAGKVPVDAYEMAVAGGYTGTKEQFEEDLGNSGTNATNAAASASVAAAAAANLAPIYSTSGTYAVGDYVLYNSGLYKCNTAITTGEAWTASHWTVVKVGTELTNTNGDVAVLREGLYSVIPKPLADETDLTNGQYVRHATGGLNSSASTSYSSYVDVHGLEYIVYTRMYTSGSSAPANGIFFYDSTQSPIANSGIASGYGASEQTAAMYKAAVPSGAYYARFSYWASTSPVYTSIPFRVYDANEYENSIATEISTIREGLNAAQTDISYYAKYNNLWAYGSITSGYALNANNGTIQVNAEYDTTDWIPVDGLKVLYGVGARYWFYDSNKAILSGQTGVLNNMPALYDGSAMKKISVPSGASYFRICSKIILEKDLYAETPYEEYLETQIHNSQNNLKLYCLGDSITRGMYAEEGASQSTGPTEYGYPYWIGQINGYTVVNLGNSGSGWANIGSAETIEDQSVQRNAKDVVDGNSFSDADIITFAFGVNDWKGAAQNIVLGDMNSVSGDGTVIGNMKYCIETTVSKKPTAQIIILLPLNTNRQWSGMATMTEADNWAFGYAYRNNQTLQDYRDAIKTCADYYNVKVVDLEEVCPINRLNIRKVCGDGLHPTMAFYKQMGSALAPLIH